VATWEGAWLAALDELEVAVADAERMLADAHREPPVVPAPWAPPSGLGPLPASLEARARSLLAQQLLAAQALAAAAVRSRRQLRVHEAMATAPAPVPVYVDVDG